jgi:hypothetical protein
LILATYLQTRQLLQCHKKGAIQSGTSKALPVAGYAAKVKASYLI